MPSQVGRVIRYFVDRLPNIGRTLVVKYLYLADLESRRYRGKPLTDLDYIWYDHGPFDSEIYAQLDILRQGNFIKQECVQYPNGKYGYQYAAGDNPLPDELAPDERAILDAVVEQYGAMSLQALLDDVVYQTKPMLDAKERNARDGQLRMELVDNEARIPGLELERMHAAVRHLDEGKGRPLDDFLANLPQ